MPNLFWIVRQKLTVQTDIPVKLCIWTFFQLFYPFEIKLQWHSFSTDENLIHRRRLPLVFENHFGIVRIEKKFLSVLKYYHSQNMLGVAKHEL